MQVDDELVPELESNRGASGHCSRDGSRPDGRVAAGACLRGGRGRCVGVAALPGLEHRQKTLRRHTPTVCSVGGEHITQQTKRNPTNAWFVVFNGAIITVHDSKVHFPAKVLGMILNSLSRAYTTQRVPSKLISDDACTTNIAMKSVGKRQTTLTHACKLCLASKALPAVNYFCLRITYSVAARISFWGCHRLQSGPLVSPLITPLITSLIAARSSKRINSIGSASALIIPSPCYVNKLF